MKLLPVGDKKRASTLREHPLVAVDMGFAGTAKSCGVALTVHREAPKSAPYYFATAAETVRDFFKKHGEGVLVIEGPLSAAFDVSRNPTARGEFEREGKPRWWNLRAGSQMALAALYFFRRLDELMPPNSAIHLVEGFVVGDKSGKHADVAATLANAFQGKADAMRHEIEAEGELVSIAEWFGQPRRCVCPVVLEPSAV
jgi:hypothetical protein